MKGKLKKSRIRWLLSFFSAVTTLAAFAMSVNAIPPLVTSIAVDFGFSINIFGYLFSLQFFIFMIASFAGGELLERTGVKPGLLVAIGLVGLSFSFFIMPMLSTLRELLFWVVLLGFSGGLVETFASVIISGYDSPGSGRLLNFSQVFYCVGAIAAPWIVASLLEQQVSWESIFILFGVLEIVLALFFIILSFQNVWGFTDTMKRGDGNPGRVDLDGEGSAREGSRGTEEASAAPLFTNALFIFLSFSILIYVLSESFLVFWLPAYLEIHYSFSPAAAARAVSYYWTGLIIGRIAVVFFPDRISLWHIIIISSAGMLGSSLVLSFTLETTVLIPMIILIGIFFGPVWATIVSIGKHNSRTPGLIAGLIGAGSLGASLGPLLSSAVIRIGGFQSFFPVLSAGLVLLIVFIIISKRTVDNQGVSV